jgi:pimeloyl-ACP methyl ester carboxylesterase
MVALALAEERPELVGALALLDAALPDQEWSAAAEAYFAEEERLLEAGDIDSAAALNASFWVGSAEPRVRDVVTEMTRRSFELQLDAEAEAEEIEPIALTRIRTPTLVIVGDRDQPEFRAGARRLVDELPDARSCTIEGASHLPALERPGATARAINEFLAAVSGPRGGAG